MGLEDVMKVIHAMPQIRFVSLVGEGVNGMAQRQHRSHSYDSESTEERSESGDVPMPTAATTHYPACADHSSSSASGDTDMDVRQAVG